jgi:hypothetical protein
VEAGFDLPVFYSHPTSHLLYITTLRYCESLNNLTPMKTIAQRSTRNAPVGSEIKHYINISASSALTVILIALVYLAHFFKLITEF